LIQKIHVPPAATSEEGRETDGRDAFQENEKMQVDDPVSVPSYFIANWLIYD